MTDTTAPDLEKLAKREARQAVFTHEAEHVLRMLSGKKRKSPAILVLGRDGFSDNSKYLYLALARRSLGFPVFWGAFNQRVYNELSARNLPVLDLTGDPAKVLSVLFEISCVVYCTNPVEATRNPLYRAALAGAYKIQLWHGIGLKRLDLQTTVDGNLLNPAFLNQLAGAVDIDEVLSPSQLYDNQWREAFGVERVLRAGFPRNEVLRREAVPEELIDAASVSADLRERGFILYAPTFSRPGTTPAWLEPQSIQVLSSFAERIGYGLAVKPHPFDRPATASEADRLPKSVVLLPPKSDVYPVLPHARAMVTDVSSLASDFLLCDKPVLFFRSKALEEKDYPEACMPVLPGRHVRAESTDAFLRAWDGIEETAAARRQLRDLYFETEPLQACETIIDRLKEVVTART